MKTLKISKRLLAIANLIDDDTSIVDVGCDHAYLDIYLVQNRNNINCIGIDISSLSINRAYENIKKYNALDNIKLFVSDGLNNINIISNSTLVISGMGTYTMINILKSADLELIDTIILQTNKNYEMLKDYIKTLPYNIVCEMSVEDKRIYNIIKLKKYKNFRNYVD